MGQTNDSPQQNQNIEEPNCCGKCCCCCCTPETGFRLIGVLSILGAIGSIVYVTSALALFDRTQQIIYWINFVLNLILTLIWIASEVMKSNSNFSGYSDVVLTFGIVYIILFVVDIATCAIMIIWGVSFIVLGNISVSTTSYYDTDIYSYNPVQKPAVKTVNVLIIIVGICLIVFAIVMFSCQIHYLCVIFGHRKIFK